MAHVGPVNFSDLSRLSELVEPEDLSRLSDAPPPPTDPSDEDGAPLAAAEEEAASDEDEGSSFQLTRQDHGDAAEFTLVSARPSGFAWRQTWNPAASGADAAPARLGHGDHADGVDAGVGAGGVGAPGPAASMQTLANYLRDGFWDDFSGSNPRWFNLGTSGTGANSGTLYYNVTGWSGSLNTFYGPESDSNGISAARAVLVRAAFDLYEAVLGINFVETTSTADHVDFFFKDSSSGAYEAEQLHSGNGGAINYAVINVTSTWQGGDSSLNGYTFQTFLHEIGHALGLGHQGLYNAGSGTPTYANSAIWANDSWAQTMMSYWDQAENTEFSNDSYARLVSPMAVDWIALNDIYAGQGFGTSNAFTGNTIWGVGTNISAATSAAFNGLADFADTNAFTIVDGGGIDTVDFSNYSANQTINLLPSSAGSTRANLSSVGGLTYNMTIAVGTIIENATTGGGNDVLYGNDFNNVLIANGGNDYLASFSGNDALYGGIGNDTLDDGAGGDTIYGGDGNDFMYAGDTSFTGDSWYGGTGIDTLSYSLHDWGTPSSPVVFDFLTGLASYNGFTESFSSIEVFFGSQGDETIISNGGSQTYYGNAGNDSMVSGLGDETMYGGTGTDVIDHRAWDGNYTFNMATGTTNFSGELYTGYEIVYMGDGNDNVTGTSAGETIYGGLGNDTINDGAGGDASYGGDGNDLFNAGDSSFTGDSWYGGNGTDTLSYEAYDWGAPFSPVVFDFLTGLASYNGFTESFSSIEVFRGSQGDETIISNGGSQTYYGNAGNDSMVSGLGDETMYGGAGIDVIDHRAWDGNYTFNMASGTTNFSGELYTGYEIAYMGDGNDSVTGTAGATTIYGGLGNDTINDGAGAGDVAYGGDGNDSMVASGGVETLDGGLGTDTVNLTAVTTGRSYNMATGLTNVANQLIANFEVAYFGSGNDTVIGSGASDTIYGGGGNDSLFGGSGVDAIYGGGGNDSIEYVSGEGYDHIYGGEGVDSVVYQEFFGDDLVINLAAGTFTGGFVDRDFQGIEHLTTSTGDDSVTGSSAANNLRLGDGNDTGFGGDGNDSILGEAGDDRVNGGGGKDTVDGGIGNDTVLGGAGNDIVNGGDGNDSVNGDAGNDTVNGGAGDDNVSGSAGNDSLLGGDGNDTLSGGDGTDNMNGGTGNDTMNGGAANDTMVGGDGNDSMNGDAGNDSMLGGDGADTLNGGDGADRLLGEAGADVLNGGTGNDTLTGGLGNDTLNGGANSDRFIFADGWGADQIVGFVTAGVTDVIDLSAVSAITGFNDLVNNHLSQIAAGAVITAGANTILLAGILGSTLQADDFIF